MANERKKLQKAALGLQDSDDEDAAVDVSTIILSFLIEAVISFVLEVLPYMVIKIDSHWKPSLQEVGSRTVLENLPTTYQYPSSQYIDHSLALQRM